MDNFLAKDIHCTGALAVLGVLLDKGTQALKALEVAIKTPPLDTSAQLANEIDIQAVLQEPIQSAGD